MDAHYETLYGIQNVKDGKLLMNKGSLAVFPTAEEAKLTLKVAYFEHRRNWKVVKLAVVFTVLSDKV